MFSKLVLYINTIQHMKASQIYYRLRKMLKLGCGIGCSASGDIGEAEPIVTLPELDFDPIFIKRFSLEELMGNKLTLLHETVDFQWKDGWLFGDQSALWNFNLHYFEYLLPLVKAWRDTGRREYLDKTIEMIEGWIDHNPLGTNPAWASYTTALRIVNWISYFGYVCDNLEKRFRDKMLKSLHEQYAYLANHLEKDILGNHYFEDLEGLVLASLLFKDDRLFDRALSEFKAECREEILSDGMHFELSPMYHKIILEGMLRIAVALRKAERQDEEIEAYLQPMLDVAYSFEKGLERVPLFNDGGNNVAKSLEALSVAAQTHFGLQPKFKARLEKSGFYFFTRETPSGSWKLIVDAGQPGPTYIPGHAHCDAMSFELFRNGKPVLVNCGTYAYQCKERAFFRSTAAHNTVMVNGIEQSQCWSAFRLGKRSGTRVIDVTNHSIEMEMTDQAGQKVKRSIELSDKLTVVDIAEGEKLTAFVHLREPREVLHDAAEREDTQPYSPEYGKMMEITVKELAGRDCVKMTMSLEN